MSTKTYTVIKTSSKQSVTEVSGDLTYLIQYFSYVLEIGSSWDKTISRQPKTIKSFITNLKKSYEAKEANCYGRTHIELKTTSPEAVTAN